MAFSDSSPTELEYNTSVQTNSSSISSTLSIQPEYTDVNALPMYRPYNHYPSFANPPNFTNFEDRPYKSAFHPVVKTSNASTLPSTAIRPYTSESNYYNPPNQNLPANDNYYQSPSNESDYNLTANDYYYGQGQSHLSMPHNSSNYNESRSNYLSTEFASNAQSIDTCSYNLPPKQKQSTSLSEEKHKTLIESLKPKNGTTFVYIFHETHIWWSNFF